MVPRVVGYYSLGSASHAYTATINAGNVTSYVVPNLTDGATYYFAVTSRDASMAESAPSNEVTKTVPSGAPVAQCPHCERDVGSGTFRDELHRCLNGLDHGVRVDVRRRYDQYHPESEPRLLRCGRLHREPQGHRPGRQQYADQEQLRHGHVGRGRYHCPDRSCPASSPRPGDQRNQCFVGRVDRQRWRCQLSHRTMPGNDRTTFVQIGTATGTAYANTGLLAGTTYRYRVRAADAAGNLSGYSSIATAATAGCAGYDRTDGSRRPQCRRKRVERYQPGLERLHRQRRGRELSHRAVPGIDLYKLRADRNVDRDIYANTGLLASTTYRYRVRAADAAGNLSGYSSVVSATTASAGAPAVIKAIQPAYAVPQSPQTTVNVGSSKRRRPAISTWWSLDGTTRVHRFLR